jgi:hypothetical protein
VLTLFHPTSVFAIDLDLRQLPSLKVEWSVPGEVTELLVEGSDVYVLTETGVSAYEAGSGRLLWQAPITGECSCSLRMQIAGNVLAVAAEHELYLIERATGARTATVTFELLITDLFGPALVVELSDSMSATELIGIDSVTGSKRGRWHCSGWLSTTYQVDGAVVVMRRDDDTYEAIGIDAESLSELWRFSPARYSDLHLLGDQILLSQPEKDHEERFQTIDPRTGELGAALPQRQKVDVWVSDEVWHLQTIAVDYSNSTFTLRRNDPEKAQPVWLVELPGGGIEAHAQVGDKLFLCIHRHPGRGLVTILDWATGEVQSTAYGFRYVQRLVAFEELLIAACEEGAVGFSSRELGPPEAGLRPVSGEVRRILASVEGKGLWQVRDAVAELSALGDEAVPHLVEALPGVSCTGLMASAKVLANAKFCDAAPLLAAHLEDMPCDSRMSSEAFEVVLAALAELGGEEQVAAVAKVLHDPDRAYDERLQALAALASIGSATAVKIIDELLQPDAAPSRSWWSPLDSSAIRDIAGHEADSDELDMAIANEDWQEYARLSKGESSIRVPTGSGSDLLIIPHSIFGGHADLWAAEVDRAGGVGEAFFLGASVNTDSIVGSDIRIRAKVEGNIATIWRVGQPDDPVRVSLAEARRDSDQDRLTDLVERRLRTDPSRRDSDGDGLDDAFDLAPNADSNRQVSEEDEILLAIFRQMHMFRPSTSELAIVVHEAGLEWRGRTGPTITLDAEEEKKFLEEAGYDGISHIRISSGFDPMLEEMEKEKPVLAAGERAYAVSSYRGGLNAIGYQVIVRKLGNHWVISKIDVTWVS